MCHNASTEIVKRVVYGSIYMNHANIADRCFMSIDIIADISVRTHKAHSWLLNIFTAADMNILYGR